MSNFFFIISCFLGVYFGLAHGGFAATVQGGASASFLVGAERDSVGDPVNLATATDGYTTSASISTSNLSGSVSSGGAMSANTETGVFETSATHSRDGSTAGGVGNGRSDFRENFDVLGDGFVTVTLALYGEINCSGVSICNPRANALLSVNASAFAPSSFADSLDTSSSGDPLFGIENGMFERILTTTFAVSDGELFFVRALLNSRAGAGLAAGPHSNSVFLTGILTVTGSGGAEALARDRRVLSLSSTPEPDVVPLPASGWLLIAGFGALLIRRNMIRPFC